MWLTAAGLTYALSCVRAISTGKIILARQEACGSATNSAAYSACAMQAAFGGSKVVPQLLTAFSPQASLSVTYGNIVIGGAQQLSPVQVSAPPNLSLSLINSSSKSLEDPYFIMGLDYQPQTEGLNLFWLQSALRIANQSSGSMFSSDEAIVPYTSPNPLPGSGTHEYILFVFPDEIGLASLCSQNPELATITSEAAFEKFLSFTNLKEQVMAGSYFKSTYDGSVGEKTPAASANIQQQKSSSESPSTKGLEKLKKELRNPEVTLPSSLTKLLGLERSKSTSNKLDGENEEEEEACTD